MSTRQKTKPDSKVAPMADANDDTMPPEDVGGEFYAIQYPVIKMIEDYMTQHPVSGKKMTLRTFSELAGIPFVTLSGIMNGHRWIARASRETIDKLGEFLEVPVLQIYFMSGFIEPKDAVSTQSLAKTLDAIHQSMVTDQAASYRVPSAAAWAKWPMDAKLCFCMMYEAYTNKRLMRYAAMHVN